MSTKEKFEIVLNLAQERLNDIYEEETFELNGEEVSVVDAMDALESVWDYKCDFESVWDYKCDLIRDGEYYGS